MPETTTPSGTTTTAPTAPTTPPPAATQEQMIATAVKTALAPVVEELEAMRAAKAAKEQEAANANAAKAAKEQEATNAKAANATLEEQLKAQQEQVKTLTAQFHASQCETAIHAAADKYAVYATPLLRRQAINLFRMDHQIEAKESGVTATIGGKSQPVEAAFKLWGDANAAPFKAAAAQPGPGVPAPSAPESGQAPKRFREMTAEEKQATLAKGITGRLTANGPVITIQRKPDKFATRREQLLGLASGIGRPKQ